MCCWPFSDTYLEEDPLDQPVRRRSTIITTSSSKAARRQRYHHRSSRGMYQYEWTGEQWMLRPVLGVDSSDSGLTLKLPLDNTAVILSLYILYIVFYTLAVIMSTSTMSPPPRDARHRERRVSFDIGNGGKAPSFFNQLAAASYATMPGNNGNRGAHHTRNSSSHHNHHSHHSRPNNQRFDRRARVDDALDGDDDTDDSEARRRASRAAAGGSRAARAAADGPSASSGPSGAAVSSADGGLPSVQPGQPSITASAAAAGYNGLDPAVSANHVFTHMDNGAAGIHGIQGIPGVSGLVGPGGVPIPQPGGYNIQAFPTFMPAGMPPGFAAYAPGGVDSSGMTGISFLPAVPDATNGPMLHTYIPRSDAPGQAGAMYMQPGYNSTGVPMAGVPIAATTSPMIPVATQGGMAYVQQPQPSVAYVGGGGIGNGGGGPPMVMMPGMGMPGGPGGNYAVGGMGGMGGMSGMGVMGGVHPEPALGVGQTPTEVLQEQLEFAYNNNMYEPQDFKPADDDKSRFYWVREMDGNWTQRSRATIDHIGCRWYITDSGMFYAVRLPN
ncbi:hypothetical protein F503_06699 [Ophiostoma piceae UAMH 11346]|uniref:Uncharacterized protein n=1 Tax=Ophiostoma piceae (strain UAMH 11346) TaxID=1262450 RepID=S3BVS1_OPHP1|nr:hypothetical protein F503_06699 [Ophiostoma piceae UAMH 11346]